MGNGEEKIAFAFDANSDERRSAIFFVAFDAAKFLRAEFAEVSFDISKEMSVYDELCNPKLVDCSDAFCKEHLSLNFVLHGGDAFVGAAGNTLVKVIDFMSVSDLLKFFWCSESLFKLLYFNIPRISERLRFFIKIERIFPSNIHIKYHIIYLCCDDGAGEDEWCVLCGSSGAGEIRAGKVKECIKEEHAADFIPVAISSDNAVKVRVCEKCLSCAEADNSADNACADVGCESNNEVSDEVLVCFKGVISFEAVEVFKKVINECCNAEKDIVCCLI